jgi:hypothetical protein
MSRGEMRICKALLDRVKRPRSRPANPTIQKDGVRWRPRAQYREQELLNEIRASSFLDPGAQSSGSSFLVQWALRIAKRTHLSLQHC